MNNQNLIVLAIGLFVTLIVTVAAIDEYLLTEHPPSQVDGLIWRVENAFSHLQDLETVLEFTEADAPTESMRVLMRFLSGPTPSLSVRYLDPASVKGQIFTVNHDLLSHYFPGENLVVVKRWVGVPLALIGLSGFDLTRLKADWNAGDVEIRVLQNIGGFPATLFSHPLAVSGSFSRYVEPVYSLNSAITTPFCCDLSFCPPVDSSDSSAMTLGFSQLSMINETTSIQGSYVLEVRDSNTSALVRMIWIERDTYLIRKVVSFENGQRDSTIRVEWVILDQGFTEEDILTLPKGVDTIRG